MVALTAFPLAHGGFHALYHLVVALHHNGIIVPLWVWILGAIGVGAYFWVKANEQS